MPEILDRVRVDLAEELEVHRGELTGHCYRMLGSGPEALEAVAEAMLRAWRQYDVAARLGTRAWLYRVANDVCLDVLEARVRRAHPCELGPAALGNVRLTPPEEQVWLLEPIADRRVLPPDGNASVAARESLRLGFIAALQQLPPGQRAVLALRDVADFSAVEVAVLLETALPSVKSQYARARRTMAAPPCDPGEVLDPGDAEQASLLARYRAAFTAFHVDALIGLLHPDAVLAMPPSRWWLRGADQVRVWLQGRGRGGPGSVLESIAANAMPAFAHWRPEPDGSLQPWAIQVLEVRDGAITGLTSFLDVARLWPMFDLPEEPARPAIVV